MTPGIVDSVQNTVLEKHLLECGERLLPAK